MATAADERDRNTAAGTAAQDQQASIEGARSPIGSASSGVGEGDSVSAAFAAKLEAVAADRAQKLDALK